MPTALLSHPRPQNEVGKSLADREGGFRLIPKACRQHARTADRMPTLSNSWRFASTADRMRQHYRIAGAWAPYASRVASLVRRSLKPRGLVSRKEEQKRPSGRCGESGTGLAWRSKTADVLCSQSKRDTLSADLCPRLYSEGALTSWTAPNLACWWLAPSEVSKRACSGRLSSILTFSKNVRLASQQAQTNSIKTA